MGFPMRRFPLAAAVLAAVLAAAPALAAPPDKGPPDKAAKGGDKGGKPAKSGDRDVKVEFTFTAADRRIVSDYYGPLERAGNCPPGLAKKNNGCRPPGQAKQWHKGQPLPAGITWYPVPGELVVRLPVPPANHEYVRVGADILLVTVGTMLVVDAIADLGRR